MKKRIFIAINLPLSIKTIIEKRYYQFLKENVPFIKLVRPENLHLTLKFLGEINIEKINLIEKNLEEISYQFHPFILEIKSIGFFPNFQKPKVLWLGIIDKRKTLQLINQKLTDLLKKEKFFLKEENSFKAHITLGRFKKRISFKDKEKLLTLKKERGNNSLGKFKVKNIDLMESKLNSEGPIYYLIKSFSLK